LATGVTWRLVIASAPWIARYLHTSVIDAAGTIYVIGGFGCTLCPDGTTLFQDVWASTDGGARPDSVGEGVLGGLLHGYYKGTTALLWGTRGVPRGYLEGS
jgi:hypothetical protein